MIRTGLPLCGWRSTSFLVLTAAISLLITMTAKTWIPFSLANARRWNPFRPEYSGEILSCRVIRQTSAACWKDCCDLGVIGEFRSTGSSWWKGLPQFPPTNGRPAIPSNGYFFIKKFEWIHKTLTRKSSFVRRILTPLALYSHDNADFVTLLVGKVHRNLFSHGDKSCLDF